MEHLNTHRMNAVSPPKSDEIAHFGASPRARDAVKMSCDLGGPNWWLTATKNTQDQKHEEYLKWKEISTKRMP